MSRLSRAVNWEIKGALLKMKIVFFVVLTCSDNGGHV